MDTIKINIFAVSLYFIKHGLAARKALSKIITKTERQTTKHVSISQVIKLSTTTTKGQQQQTLTNISRKEKGEEF